MLCLTDVPGEAFSFLLGNKGGVHLGWRELLGGVEGGEIMVGMYWKQKKRKRKASASWKDTQQLGAGIVEDLDLVRSTHMVDYIRL